MIDFKDLYIENGDFLKSDYFRFGDKDSPRFYNARPFIDVATTTINGIETVIANGNGISLTSVFNPKRKYTWKISAGARIPEGIRLVKDLRRGHETHYMLVPIKNMPLAKYVGLLQELIQYSQRVS